jgi:hypothetical protein
LEFTWFEIDALAMMVVMGIRLTGIDGSTLFLKQHLWNLDLFVFTENDDIAYLPGGEGVDHRLIFLCDFHFLFIVGVRSELHCEFINCLGIGFAVHQHHASANSVGLLLQPLLGIAQGTNC